jgi:putative ABC transport system substrate-binding protein
MDCRVKPGNDEAMTSHGIHGLRRRDFITLVGGGAAIALPHAARAQQTEHVRRIGVLIPSHENDPEMQARVAAVRSQLRELGWREGDNLHVEWRWFGADAKRAQVLAGELVKLVPDVILASSSVGIEAALKATRSIPTVFALVGNPVGSGYVSSLARPGGHVTGFSAFEPEIAGKWVQIVKEIAPATREVGVLFYPGYEWLWAGAVAAAAPAGIAANRIECRSAADFEAVFAALATRHGTAAIVLPTPAAIQNRDLIIRLAAAHALPAIYPFRHYVRAGGLLSYGLDTVDIYRRAATYVDRILRGERPGDLPVQAPVKFELVINLKTAKVLGLTVTPTLLARADEVIE